MHPRSVTNILTRLLFKCNPDIQAALRSLKSDHNMPLKLKNSSPKLEFRDEEIIAGFKFKMQYLGCCEGLNFGGTDHEVASIIHDIHALYAGRNTKLSKARTVVVFVDAEMINIYNKNEDEILLSFPLVYVKDVTTCLDQPPYSKTCVLVARQYNEPLYKALVFYFKSTARAAEFYHFTTNAFKLGFERMERFTEHLDSASTSDEASSESPTPNGNISRANSHSRPVKGDLDLEDGDCDSEQEFGKSYPESQRLLDGNEILQLKGIDSSQRKSPRQQAVTVRLSNDDSNFERRHETHEIKFNLNLGDDNNDSNPSKFDLYMNTVGKSSRFFNEIPHWFRSSYSKFRKFSSSQRSTSKTDAEDV